MNRILEWKSIGRECSFNSPWIETYECEIGNDEIGMDWRARCQYRYDEHRFHVWFDKMETHETDDGHISSPFLRPEVIYARNYWKANKEYFHLVSCDYEDIAKVVESFMVSHNIN